ncbi:hypothetical protein E2C01_060074 [Portunus trituberculatus]|uniref:Uncharacterized protein n=1 Tax=Portunus trituberculatus TaxID=210409 RepID=A0A5B7H7R2_PORTR|nr:hypothetical protein [Portunus trituberculatus]
MTERGRKNPRSGLLVKENPPWCKNSGMCLLVFPELRHARYSHRSPQASIPPPGEKKEDWGGGEVEQDTPTLPQDRTKAVLVALHRGRDFVLQFLPREQAVLSPRQTDTLGHATRHTPHLPIANTREASGSRISPSARYKGSQTTTPLGNATAILKPLYSSHSKPPAIVAREVT